MLKDYSEAEIKLFNSLNLEHMLNAPVNPMAVYRFAVEESFLNNLSGPNIYALRRGACMLFREHKLYRKTKEFDDLISF